MPLTLLRIAQVLLFATIAAYAEETPVADRISKREFPSVFQAWNEASPLPGSDATAMRARHDLVFLHPSMFGLRSEESFEGTALGFTPTSVTKA